MIVELYHTPDKADEPTTENMVEEDQAFFQDALRRLFDGAGESFKDIKMTISRTAPRSTPADEAGAKSTPDWDLAKLYMDVLRSQGSR